MKKKNPNQLELNFKRPEHQTQFMLSKCEEPEEQKATDQSADQKVKFITSADRIKP